MARSVSTWITVATLTATLGLTAACGSDSDSGGGGGSVSQSQLEQKLKSDSDLKTQLSGKIPSQAMDLTYTCVAKAMKKDLSDSDLKNYVDDKKSINSIGTKGQSTKLATDLKNCLLNGVRKGSASPSK
ncbi:hypothetical protein SAMN05443575_0943 [Jatrophihabitans endophyticus]|uniref:Lipoprotein n=1 Tax=Jatrophihabitans endophyticus TaxID=1206085 RepID=A0A1M5EMZ5_9ACTN|nr:hypothetical protein [Jatrophihabitans endophyticus]SHF80577.1 hypothetical protein SAMN05443575_0943 [Jatrophihabitans endophyticus]